MWEDQIRIRGVLSLVAGGFAVIALSAELDEAPWCLTAVAGAAMIQTIILFGVLSVGIVFQEMEKGRRKA